MYYASATKTEGRQLPRTRTQPPIAISTARPVNRGRRSPRAEIAEFVGEFIDHHDSFTLSQITALAVARFQTEADFLQRFLEEQFAPMVRDIVATRVRQTRGLIPLGDRYVSRDEWFAYVQAQSPRFAVWREYTSRGHVRLMDMTVPQLDDAIAIRQRRVANEIGVINFLIDLRNRILNVGAETVKDVFSPDDLARTRAEWSGVEPPDDDQPGPN